MNFGLCGSISRARTALAMYKINRIAEPANFNTQVRQPGVAFLAQTPNPTYKQWISKNYWSTVSKELYEGSGGICAYSGCLIPYVVGTPTIDHQRPKDIYPALAYEWDNYILAALLPNSLKRKHLVLDPRKIGDDWFELNIPTLEVEPNTNKSPRIVKWVEETIKHLKLNDKRYIVMRQNNISPFIHGNWDYDYLLIASPFIAKELTRQNLDDPVVLARVLSLPKPPIFL